MINHIPIKQVLYIYIYIYIDKRCTKMGGSKIAKKPNEIYIYKTKVLKLGSPKIKGLKKPS